MARILYRLLVLIQHRIRVYKIRILWFVHYRSFLRGIDKTVRIEPKVDFFFRRRGDICVNEKTLICKNSKIVIDGGKLSIGSGCTFGANNIFNVFDEIKIGDNVLSADRVSFITNTHNYTDITIPVCQQGGGCRAN